MAVQISLNDCRTFGDGLLKSVRETGVVFQLNKLNPFVQEMMSTMYSGLLEIVKSGEIDYITPALILQKTYHFLPKESLIEAQRIGTENYIIKMADDLELGDLLFTVDDNFALTGRLDHLDRCSKAIDQARRYNLPIDSSSRLSLAIDKGRQQNYARFLIMVPTSLSLFPSHKYVQ